MTHSSLEKLRRFVRGMKRAGGSSLQDALKMEPLLDEIEAVALFPSGERFRHNKRGTTYDIYGVGHANSAKEVLVTCDMEGQPFRATGEESYSLGLRSVIFDRDKCVLYRDVQSGELGFRAKDEFLDGRFTLLPPLPGAPPVEASRALGEYTDGPPRKVAANPAQDSPYARHCNQPIGGTRYVRYCGTDKTKKGWTGKVIRWEGGNVLVEWEHRHVTLENAFNVEPWKEEEPDGA